VSQAYFDVAVSVEAEPEPYLVAMTPRRSDAEGAEHAFGDSGNLLGLWRPRANG